jgi:hypothetical protein|tara:strand:- start:1544 stop:2011 length:468 start_codon:yes stop_codon:yes gene_type:complete
MKIKFPSDWKRQERIIAGLLLLLITASIIVIVLVIYTVQVERASSKTIQYYDNLRLKAVYCEHKHHMFIGLDDKEIINRALTKYQTKQPNGSFANTWNETFIIANALFCDERNTTCSRYQNNEWIYTNTICHNFDFALKDMLRPYNASMLIKDLK